MSGELVIGGGGSVAIATEPMLAAIDACERAAHVASVAAADLAIAAVRLDDWAADGPAGHAMRLAGRRADDAAVLARAAAPPAAALGTALQLAAEGYGLTERVLTGAAELVAEQIAASIGRALPGLALAALPHVAFVVAGAGLAALVAPHVVHSLGLDDELSVLGRTAGAALNDLVCDPNTVSLIRQAVMIADDAMLGALGVPATLAPVLGEDGLGLAGMPMVAGLITGVAGSIGLLRETPVRMAESTVVTTRPVDPAQGWVDRLDRIPAPAGGDGMQVVIEKYSMPDGTERFEVFVSGTVTFDPVADAEPFDLTSNIENAKGADAASVRAVVDAMRAAGVDETTPVILNGYSQGGGVVARVAGMDEFDVFGVVSFGGNTGQTPIPDDVLAVIIEHDDDVVPALGGRQDNTDALLITREAYGPGTPPPAGVVVPAHRRPAYAETAALMDAATSERITTVGSQFERFADGATAVEVSTYRFERVVP
jgi:hypothetical protein